MLIKNKNFCWVFFNCFSLKALRKKGNGIFWAWEVIKWIEKFIIIHFQNNFQHLLLKGLKLIKRNNSELFISQFSNIPIHHLNHITLWLNYFVLNFSLFECLNAWNSKSNTMIIHAFFHTVYRNHFTIVTVWFHKIDKQQTE